jgi:predicted transcriptional regulator
LDRFPLAGQVVGSEPGPAPQTRAQRLHTLLNAMQAAPMTLREIAQSLDFSLSGARKYVRFLIEEQMVKRTVGSAMPEVPRGAAVYSLTASKAEMAVLLARLEQDQTMSAARLPAHEPASRRTVVTVSYYGEAGSQRACDIAAQRDPLVAALFGHRDAVK